MKKLSKEDLLAIFSDKPKQIDRTISKIEMAELNQLWNLIAGSSLASHSSPVAIEGQILIIHADHNIFAQEISMLKSELTRRITRITGKIYQIEVKVGKPAYFSFPPKNIENQNIQEDQKRKKQDVMSKYLNVDADPEIDKILNCLNPPRNQHE